MITVVTCLTHLTVGDAPITIQAKGTTVRPNYDTWLEVDHNKIRCNGQTSLTPPLTPGMAKGVHTTKSKSKYLSFELPSFL